jgi:hypothetical protein
MKTFKQFQEQSSLSQAFAKAGKPSIPSERPTSVTTLDSLRAKNTSDMARPTGNTSGVPTTPINQSTYRGRVEAGRNTPDRRYQNAPPADNPNFQGPVLGAGSGTKDRMPGTVPQSNPQLPNYTNKSVSPKPLGTNLAKPIPKPTTGGPIKPRGTGGWV